MCVWQPNRTLVHVRHLLGLLPAGSFLFCSSKRELHISVYIYEAHLHLADVAESVTGRNMREYTLSRSRGALHLESGHPSWKVIQLINSTTPAASVAVALKATFLLIQLWISHYALHLFSTCSLLSPCFFSPSLDDANLFLAFICFHPRSHP